MDEASTPARCASFRCTDPAGEPLTGFCRYHWIARPGKGRPREQPGELDEVLSRLAIRPGTPLYRYEFDGADVRPQWRGYRVELVAIDPPAAWWRGYPRSWGVRLPDESETKTVVRWRAWASGRPGHLTVSWRPRVGEWSVLEGPPSSYDDELGVFLKSIQWKVRPGPAPEMSREELEAAVVTVMRKLWIDRKRCPSLPEVGTYFLTHRDELFRLYQTELPTDGKALGQRLRRADPPLRLPALRAKARPDANP